MGTCFCFLEDQVSLLVVLILNIPANGKQDNSWKLGHSMLMLDFVQINQAKCDTHPPQVM